MEGIFCFVIGLNADGQFVAAESSRDRGRSYGLLTALRCGSGIAALVHELREHLTAFCVNNICDLLQGGDVFLIGDAVGIVAYGIPLHVGKYNKTGTALGAFLVEEDFALGGISVFCISVL
jgi:hypothetical protein